MHETMYVPAVKNCVKGQIALGRPVKFEAFMAHMKADQHAVGGRRPHRAGGRRQDAGRHSSPAIDSITDDVWRAPVAKFFKGEIVVGEDLMVV